MALNIPMPVSGGEAFTSGLQTGSEILNRLLQLKQQQIENQNMQAYRKSDLALRQQAAAMEKEKQPYQIDLLKQQANANNALAALRKSGGSGGSVGFKDLLALQNQVMKDNPGIDHNKAAQIASAWLSGNETLENGENVPPPSGISSQLINQIVKRGSTSPLITTGIQAKQADAEINIISDLARKWNAPYGNTFLNKSPKQISDTFKSDEASQTRLGEFIAGQQLQNELAQMQNRIALGQPGITNTHDLIKAGMQKIDASYPMLSNKAREVAQQRFTYALQKGLAARQSIGIGASNAVGGSNNTKSAIKLSDGKVLLYKDGEEYHIPSNLMNKALSEGFSLEP